MTDAELYQLTKRRLGCRPETPESWVAMVAELRALAAEIRRRLPDHYAGHPLDV